MITPPKAANTVSGVGVGDSKQLTEGEGRRWERQLISFHFDTNGVLEAWIFRSYSGHQRHFLILSILYYTMLCYAMLCYAILYYTILYHITLYYTYTI